MELAIYIIIGTMSIFTIIGIPAIIWGIYDNKKREQQEQDSVSPTTVPHSTHSW